MVTALRFLFTTLIAIIFLYAFGASKSLNEITSQQTLKLFIIALSTGMMALWIYYLGLKKTQVKVSTIIELIFPVVAIVIDIFLYKNVLAVSQYIAAAILIFAIFKVGKLNKDFKQEYKTYPVKGAGRGTRIGFPTINFYKPQDFEHAYGIYCGYVFVNEKKYKAAFHYGPIPTFHEDLPSLEAFILEGKIQKLPKELSIQFISKIRDMENFKNSDILAKQIKKDVAACKNLV